MPTESKHEQIAVYVAARLAEITIASGAWYTINRVARVSEPQISHWTEARGITGVNCFALVFPGQDEQATSRSTERVQKDMLLDIVISRRAEIDRATAKTASTEPERIFPDNAADALPLKWTIQDRLLKDIKDKLNADLTFGGLLIELLLPDHENRQYYVDGWDCAHLPILCRYSHPRRVS